MPQQQQQHKQQQQLLGWWSAFWWRLRHVWWVAFWQAFWHLRLSCQRVFYGHLITDAAATTGAAARSHFNCNKFVASQHKCLMIDNRLLQNDCRTFSTSAAAAAAATASTNCTSNSDFDFESEYDCDCNCHNWKLKGSWCSKRSCGAGRVAWWARMMRTPPATDNARKQLKNAVESFPS